MRITIETTASVERRVVTSEIGHDDLTIVAVADMLRGLLVAFGYHPENVADTLPAE